MNLRKPVYARGTRRRRVCHECSVAAQTRAETFESRLLLSAVTVRLSASRDTTIYDPVAGDVSNGSGQFIVTGGSAAQSDIHRGLIAFDLSTAGIPAGATVIDAALTMQVADSHGGVATVGLYRTLSAWGEGLSNAPGSELEGADAVQSDATWLFRFFDGTPWNSPGGDSLNQISASTLVTDIAAYEWTGAGLTGDVQQWLDNPDSNFGWQIRSDESSDAIRSFYSRNSANAALRPVLEITYEEPLLTGIIEGRKWHDRNADGLRPPVEVAQLKLELRNGEDYFNSYGGNEYWYYSASGSAWYFLLPDGQLKRWSNTPRQLTGQTLVTLEPRYRNNPSALLSDLQTSDEPWLNGIQIELLNATGTVIATTTTRDMDRNGDGVVNPETERGWYRFAGLSPAEYTVREVVPDGWAQSTSVTSVHASDAYELKSSLGIRFNGSYYQNSGFKGEKWLWSSKGWIFITPSGDISRWNRVKTSQQSPVSGTYIANLGAAYFRDPSLLFLAEDPAVKVEAGQTVQNVNFGNYRPVSVSGRTWRDTNANGLYDPVGIGTLVPSSVLPSGVPSGDYLWFQQSVGTPGSGATSYYYINGSSLYQWSPTRGSTFISSVPAGVTPSPTASPITAFDDETWLNGWQIELLDEYSNVIAVQTTRDLDINKNGRIEPDSERGWYKFENLPPGRYSVREVNKTGWIMTSATPPEMQTRVKELQSQYAFSIASRDDFNWGGRNERWFKDRAGDHFFITPDGTISKWDRQSGGNRGKANGTVVARLSPEFFLNMNLLRSSASTSVSLSSGQSNTKLNIGNHRVSDGFFASLEDELFVV